MAKSAPINVRLRPDLHARVTALAKRTGRSKSSVIEELLDEAERVRRFPGIHFIESAYGRSAAMPGRRLKVWQVIQALQDFEGDAERMAKETDLSSTEIELARAYYREFPKDIDEAIARNRRPVEELLREYPFLQVMRVDV
jgi:uncharacterized protein (DUF433 family)